MTIRKPILAIIAALTLAAAVLPATQASATTAIVAGGGATGAPWPVWALGAGVLSIMVRAAYVYRTECRELTTEEAFGGMVGPWPIYHQAKSQCGGADRAPVIGRY